VDDEDQGVCCELADWEGSRGGAEGAGGGRPGVIIAVVCDESGHTKFPFLYLDHVTCSPWLRLGSVPAQDSLRLAHLCSP
jgi:hypothetical protein